MDPTGLGWLPMVLVSLQGHIQPLEFITLEPRSQQMSGLHALDVVSKSGKGSRL